MKLSYLLARNIIFFFNDTATTEIYTLSLHDALPISMRWCRILGLSLVAMLLSACGVLGGGGDRKSTRLNSSHSQISYAVFCLKKKKIANCPRTLTCTALPPGARRLVRSRHPHRDCRP